jgi:outer membrane protein assembly factor BamB
MRTIPKSRVITRFLRVAAPALVVLVVSGLAAPTSAAPATPVPTAPTPAGNLATTPDRTPSFNGPVRALAYRGGTVYIGGEFTLAYDGQRWHTRKGLAAVDARTGALLPWRPAADDGVTALVAANGTIFAAGTFTRVNDERRRHLVALDPVTGAVRPFMKHAVEGPVFAAAIGYGRLYLAGRILSVDGEERYGAAAFSLATGELVRTWRPAADGRIESIATGGGRVYLAGKFHALNNTRGTAFLAAVDPDQGRVIGRFKPKARQVVHAVAVTADRVYAGTGGSGGQGVAMNLDGRPLWRFTTDGDVQAIGVLRGTVVFGGHFDNACRTDRTAAHGRCVDGAISRVKMAAVRAHNGQLLSWSANANGIEGVVAFAQDMGLGKIAAGGSFTSISGEPQQRFAQFSLR